MTPKWLAWDTETHKIQPGLLAPPIVCHSFVAEKKEAILLDKVAGLEFIKSRLHEESVFVGANVAYDFCCLLAEAPDYFPLVWKAYEDGRVWDVLTAATLVAIAEGRFRKGTSGTQLFDRSGRVMIDPGKGTQTNRYSLAVVTKEWCGRENAKENDRFRMSYALLEHLPIEMWPHDARQYPIDDVVNTLDVAIAQRDSGFDFTDLKVQVHAAFCAQLSAVYGLRTDPNKFNKLKAELQEKHATLRVDSFKNGFIKEKKQTKKDAAAGLPVEFQKDTKVLKEAITKAYLGTPPLAEKGGVSTSRTTLEESGDKKLEAFAEVGKVEKLMSYFPSLEAASKVPLNIKPNILLSTGRASYEGIIQLLPRKGGLRDCFKALGTFVSVDYAAVEMSTLAQVCLWMVGESKLADAINSGQDPHCIISANMTGSIYEEFYAKYKAGDKVLKDIRQAGKAGDFGYPGMMGAPKFVIAQRNAGHSVCEWMFQDGRCGEERVLEWKGRTWVGGPLCFRCIEESAKIKKAFLTTWTEVPKYWDKIKEKLEYTDVIKQFVSNRLRGGVTEPQAANTLFQGLAADGAKRAVIAMTKEMYLDRSSPLFGSRLVVFAHDETIIDVPEYMDLHEAGYRQRDIMVQEMQKVCPDVKISAEPAAARYWWKQMEPRFNTQGRLIPWEPELVTN